MVYAKKLVSTDRSSVSYDIRDCYTYIDRIYCKLSDGDHLGFRGSNHMFRDLDWVGTIDNCIETFGYIPIGSFAFMCRTKKMEKPLRYHDDNLPDAYMVGIVCNTDSLHYRKWTYIGLSRKIFYAKAINEYLDRRIKDDNTGEV